MGQLCLKHVAQPVDQAATWQSGQQLFLWFAKGDRLAVLVQIGQFHGESTSAFLIAQFIHKAKLFCLGSTENSAISELTHCFGTEPPACRNRLHELVIAAVD